MNGSVFENWVNVDWPADIPSDCTNLVEGEDCLERNLPTACPSCWEYQRRMDEYFSDGALATSK